MIVLFPSAVLAQTAFHEAYEALQAKDTVQALVLFRTCVENGKYGSDCYQWLITICEPSEKTALIDEALAAYPKSKEIRTHKVNDLLLYQRYDEAEPHITKLLKKDKKNTILYYARGSIRQDRVERIRAQGGDVSRVFKEAAKDYKKAMKLDPAYWEPFYAYGSLYYNEGAEMLDQANLIVNDQEYIRARDKANAVLLKALPALERAHELNPSDQATIISLKEIYARENRTADYERMKALLD